MEYDVQIDGLPDSLRDEFEEKSPNGVVCRYLITLTDLHLTGRDIWCAAEVEKVEETFQLKPRFFGIFGKPVRRVSRKVVWKFEDHVCIIDCGEPATQDAYCSPRKKISDKALTVGWKLKPELFDRLLEKVEGRLMAWYFKHVPAPSIGLRATA